ncbi:RNA polymerase sigma factor [Prosthecobacter sp.]|uniref:RNA polymerase sigma factor n=1 Tax=Prosthecobacter sp. TaxID=1965333 RepID=UPI002AB9E4E4|nr:RNA polymerase sigma factor [Prosthecobacter sp.]MDZ4401456.1 RNA polymerase sigma factor [Prosthecobacter sp.]
MPSTEATLIRLHADYAISAYQFAWSVTKDEPLAQDVVQGLFLKLARDADAITSAQSERAMIFTLVRNLALDALRRRSTREKALDRWAEELPEWFEPHADAPTEDQRLLLTAALAALPEDQRSVIHLHLWEELSFREIGELLDLRTQTIASRYRYGLEKLRTQKHILA